jgi:prenyltransferase beta subunit
MATTSSEDYDFGFTFSDEEEVKPPVQPQQSNEEIKALQEKVDAVLNSQNSLLEEKYKAKLKEVENLILPLLYNLMKNPDKAYIKWENREPIIKKQIERITAITRG